jgi:hypothetical protein
MGRPWLHSNHVIPSTLHQCLKYIENDKQKRIDGDVKPFGVHKIKFNDAQYFLPKSAMVPSRPTRKAGQKPFNEGPKFEVSSGEEEEVKFNFKLRGARAQRPRKTRKRDPTPSVPSKTSPGAQNMKIGHDALDTAENESGRAKHENGTRRPRYRRKRIRA